MSNKIVKNAAILAVITLVAGLLLGVVQGVTEEPIAKAKEAARQEAYKQVLSEADKFEPYADFDAAAAKKAVAEIEGTVIDEVVAAKKGSQDAGYVITVTDKNGYGGNIQVSVGILPDKTVNGIAILSINETAGLGMNAKKPEFYEQYAGKKTESFYVSKDGGNGEKIQAISGATITSRAVTGAVNAALAYYETIGGSVNE